MMTTLTALFTATVLAFAATPQSAAPHPDMPPGMSHEEHLRQMQKDADLKRRGADAMGFDQDAVAHHFRLAADGGSIEVTVTNRNDTATVQQVRVHLREIAGAFADGDFRKPLATHDELPAGAAEMQARRSAIRYTYEDLDGGGRVRIVTADAAALEAVHEFLRYQIREHHTGDPR
jgi:hypothetical protein